MVLRPFPLIVALTLLMVCGLVHGFWTQRWRTSEALDGAVARLNAVPMNAGPWHGVKVDVDPEPFEQARAVGYWMRRYTNQAGESIGAILMCGRAGHMAVHTPDICYRGAGYEMVGEPAKYLVNASGKDFEFWTARFRLPRKSGPAELTIFWAWRAEDSWLAPSSPRLVFGGQPYLYKLYVVRESVVDPPNDRVAADFLRHLMPELDAALFSPRRTGL